MVSSFRSGFEVWGLGLYPGRAHCVVFLSKTLLSQCLSLHPGVQMGTSKGNARW